ncbi:hypothetical protein BE221DRAFT_102404, partial [Ostreococcus tauri]
LVPCIIEFRLIIARALRAPFSASPSSLITATPASSTLDIERRRLPRASTCASAQP